MLAEAGKRKLTMDDAQAATAGGHSATAPAAGVCKMTFHHVGVAVRSIEAALAYYIDVFGFRQVAEPVEVPLEHVRVCFIEARPGVKIELVEGVGEASPVHQILERTGGGTYHICYRVDDLDDAVRTLRAHRCLTFKRFEVPAHGRFAFLLTPDRQLFELCEVSSSEGAE